MESSEREDYLEAVLMRYLAARAPPLLKDVAQELHQSEDTVTSNLKKLEKQGDLVMDGQGAVSLTVQGHTTAERVLKKHRVLQCFLGEILGMDDHAASDEACVLEHSVSDTTINRIGNYVKNAGHRRRMHRENTPGYTLMGKNCLKSVAAGLQPGLPVFPAPGLSSRSTCSSLIDAQESVPLTVVGITGGDHLHRLIDLGVIPGEVVVLRRRLHNNAVVLQVKGCDIALSPEIAGTILVENLE
jgi:DtxR family transcriptional regulator, Mn-dependent transcriptional regulator